MTDPVRRYRIRRDRLPRVVFAVSARMGQSAGRVVRHLEPFAPTSGTAPEVLLERDATSTTLRSDGGQAVAIPAAVDAAALLAAIGYRPGLPVRIERETYRNADALVSIDHVEPTGWFCTITATPSIASELVAALELAAEDLVPAADEAYLPARRPSPPEAARAGGAFTPMLAGAGCAILAALVFGLSAALGALVALALAYGGARLVGFDLGSAHADRRTR